MGEGRVVVDDVLHRGHHLRGEFPHAVVVLSDGGRDLANHVEGFSSQNPGRLMEELTAARMNSFLRHGELGCYQRLLQVVDVHDVRWQVHKHDLVEPFTGSEVM